MENLIGRKFAPNSVTTVKITDNTVESIDLFSRGLLGAVTTDKIGSGAVDTRHIGDDQIGSGEIAVNSVRTVHIQADAVNSSKISNGTITLADMNSNVVLPPPSTGGNFYYWVLRSRPRFAIAQHSYSGAVRMYLCGSNTRIIFQIWRNNTRIHNTSVTGDDLTGICDDYSVNMSGHSLQVGDLLYVTKSSRDRLNSHCVVYEAE